MLRIRSETVRKALYIIPRFSEMVGRLGLDRDDINGLYGLAGILVYLGWPNMVIPYHYSLRFLGLYKAKGKEGRKIKHVQGSCRRLFMIFSEAIVKKRGDSWPPRLRYQRKLLRDLVHLLQEMRGPT